MVFIPKWSRYNNAKPSGKSSVNWNNPLAEGLVDALIAVDNPSCVQGVAPLVVGYQGDGDNYSLYSSSDKTARIDYGNLSQYRITGALTIVDIFSLASNSLITNRGLTTKWLGAGNQRSYSTFINYQTGAKPRVGMEISSDGAGTRNSIIGGTVLDINKKYISSAVYRPSESLTVYLDGKQDGVLSSGVLSGIYNSTASLWRGNLFSLIDASAYTLFGKIYDSYIYNRALSVDEVQAISEAPYQILKPRVVYFDFGGGSADGNATNTPPPLVLTPPTVSASGTSVVHGNATINLPTVSLVPPTLSASGTAVVHGEATTTPASIVLTPPTGTASGTVVIHGNASTSPTVISLVAIGNTASGSAVGSNTSASINLLAPSVSAVGTVIGEGHATCTLPAVNLIPPTVTASGNASTSVTSPSISFNAPTVTASGAADGDAVGFVTLPTIDLSTLTVGANGSAVGSVSLPTVTLVNPTVTATVQNAVDAVAQVTPATIVLTPPTMFASIGEAWREYYTFDMEVTTTVAFELELTRTVDFTLEL